MSHPRRRPLHRDNLDIETTLERYHALAKEIELGITLLRQEMRDVGWPARTPEGDRKPNAGTGGEPSAIDYADPCGDMALRLDRLVDDLESFQDHWHIVSNSLPHIAKVARKYLQDTLPGLPAVPVCSVTTCDNEVEAKVTHGRRVYVGMEPIAGHWVERRGMRATCSQHRRQRDAA